MRNYRYHDDWPASAPELVQIIQGTIAAAAVINEIIAVIAAKRDLNSPEKSTDLLFCILQHCLFRFLSLLPVIAS